MWDRGGFHYVGRDTSSEKPTDLSIELISSFG